jgi:hypothetical protein
VSFGIEGVATSLRILFEGDPGLKSNLSSKGFQVDKALRVKE